MEIDAAARSTWIEVSSSLSRAPGAGKEEARAAASWSAIHRTTFLRSEAISATTFFERIE
jgi:hypothetical protein